MHRCSIHKPDCDFSVAATWQKSGLLLSYSSADDRWDPSHGNLEKGDITMRCIEPLEMYIVYIIYSGFGGDGTDLKMSFRWNSI